MAEQSDALPHLADITFDTVSGVIAAGDATWHTDDHADIAPDDLVGAPVIEAVSQLIGLIGQSCEIISIGHRLVHGGPRFNAPVLINQNIRNELNELVAFDALHMTDAVQLIDALAEQHSNLPQVACFDTSFYKDMPELAQLIALPAEYRSLGIRRYGFHGLSYTFVQREFERFAGTAAKNGRVIYAHLGSGSSITATRDGQVIDTTMGFSPASGIPSSSRVGDIDPTIPGFLEKATGLSATEFSKVAQTSSGLLALSETSSSMKHLIDVEASDERAALAVSYYVYRASATIGGLVTAIGGIDSLVFTGGIGAQSSPVRNRICRSLEHLGVRLDNTKNEQHQQTISHDDSRVGVHVVTTDEALIIAEQTIETIRLPKEAR